MYELGVNEMERRFLACLAACSRVGVHLGAGASRFSSGPRVAFNCDLGVDSEAVRGFASH